MEENVEKNNLEVTRPYKDDKGHFLPGVSGNPNGRPKGSISIVAKIREKLEEIPQGEKKTYLEIFVDKVFKKTNEEGDVAMMKDVIDRIDGKPKQDVDVTSGGQPISIQIMRYGNSENPVTQTSGSGDIQSEQVHSNNSGSSIG